VKYNDSKKKHENKYNLSVHLPVFISTFAGCSSHANINQQETVGEDT